MSNAAAVALARQRWDNVSEEERLRIGRELTESRLKLRRLRRGSKPKSKGGKSA